MTVQETSGECVKALKSSGFNFFTGVADSLLAQLIRDLEQSEPGYVPATREDLAVGLASGAFLGGRLPAVLMQNSGLGYCLNALTSLNLLYKIPTLLIIGYRGYLGKDAPEHLVMGAHCEQICREVGIPVFVPDADKMALVVADAADTMKKDKIPVALFVRPGMLG